MTQMPRSLPHYPFVSRMILDLWHANQLPQVASLWVEPEWGHLVRLVYNDGTTRVLRASACDINAQGAAAVARDKADTRTMLQALGYCVPQGVLCASPATHKVLAARLPAHSILLGTPALVADWVEAAWGYPCYTKPVHGGQGVGVRCGWDRAGLQASVAALNRTETPLFLVEAAVPWPEYRVVVLNGRVVASYERRPLAVVGDGRASVAQLLASSQRAAQMQHDPWLGARLQAQGLTLASVPPSGARVRLHDVANLSAGGTAIDVGAVLAPDWQQRCIEIVAAVGLRFCGVDLACADITSAAAPYAIFELNSAPGLEYYARLGAAQAERVRAIYRELLLF
jgi:hypothetical protein